MERAYLMIGVLFAGVFGLPVLVLIGWSAWKRWERGGRRKKHENFKL